MNKKEFLKSIKGKNKYKRVIESPLRYAGGKSLAVGFIAEKIPENIKTVVSPFFGGGSVEIALNKYLGIKIKGYDIFDILVNYWNIQINNPIELGNKLKKLKNSKEEYKINKEILKKHWDGEKKLNKIDLATYYFYNHNLSYGPMFLGWFSSNYLDDKKYENMIKRVKNFQVKDITVECKDFEKSILENPNEFLYLDPPYYLEEGKMFKGIYPNTNFAVHHNNFDHKKLLKLLKNHKGGFLMSYNNCETIREWYKDFEQTFPEWQYTYGQGEKRIGKNRLNGSKNNIKESHEILIYCKPLN